MHEELGTYGGSKAREGRAAVQRHDRLAAAGAPGGPRQELPRLGHGERSRLQLLFDVVGTAALHVGCTAFGCTSADEQ